MIQTSSIDAALTLASESSARLTPVYVVDFLVPAHDMYGYDPSILADAFREEGLRVTDAAAAARGVTGTPKIANVEPGGEDVAQRIPIVAEEAGADLTWYHTGFQCRSCMAGSAVRFLTRMACRP
ncbi:universal stress protein [Burkholderia sp. NFACC33-1]|uniref:UspA domain-containing protein n=1 Tax=Burkholderia pyrrocinia TaxID=60550 RepID=A0A318IK84_BURPY|nr:hypothetical protein NA66_1009151 [Burkholderia pyrrocinia]SFW65018.1 hypothetical protein SAMN03159384_03541 [Burkholderia sp. NFACC33-1]SFY21680.1 hypothetical protein SAMN03159408_03628 [Burkholderia sp. NFPP32]